MSETIRLLALERHFRRGETAVQALRGLDLTIAAGEFVALVGPSGSGKSTLLNLLGGLDRPSAGELWLNGAPLHSADDNARTYHRKEQVGFIFQSFNLLPRLTALENVAVPLMLAGVPKVEREARARALLQRVGLGHRLDHYPTELSGGEQQRTAVARALIHNPALVLADEPTGNLDSATGESIMSLLQSLNREQGITLIVVTHDPDVAAYAERIVRLRDGEIVAIEENGRREPATIAEKVVLDGPLAKKRGLTLHDILQSALRNLGRRPVRNALTASGVLIGIVTLVAMVSFGVGVQREVQRNFAMVGLENIFVSPQFAEADGFDPFAMPRPQTPLTPELVAQIAAIPGVAGVTPLLALPSGMDISLTVGAREAIPVRIASGGGTPFNFGPPARSGMLAGQTPTELGEGVLLVVALADELKGANERYIDLIGRSVVITVKLPRGEMADFASRIVGVQDGFARRSIDVGLAEREAMVAWWFNRPDFLQTEGYNQLVVGAADLGVVTAVSTAIRELNLQAQSLDTILDAANQVLALLQALLGSVGGLALLVAALGVANTMMMAIYERTREIGVLKALGASAREIRRMFTVEAGLIGLIGGVFGLIFGTLLGKLVDWIAHRFLVNEGVTGVGALSVVPWWLALGALLFATMIGILAGLYPAARAARLDPVTALRHE